MLLNSMGVRWMESKLEGEAQCAQLEQRGLVHGCITRDFDYILFGGNNLYQARMTFRNFQFRAVIIFHKVSLP